jgi:hypothetical protein
MRIIAAEVAITPENHPEVEVGMLPLDLDLPGPSDRVAADSPVTEARRFREALLRGVVTGRTVTVRLTLHTSRGDLTIRQPVVLQAEEPPEQTEALDQVELPRRQYQALLRSVERASDPDPGLSGYYARLPRRPFAPCDHTMVKFSRS